MFYLFYSCLVQNTASANRFLSFLKGFDQLGVEVTVVLLSPSYERSIIQDKFSHISIIYLWKDWPFFRRFLDKLYLPIAEFKFFSRLRRGDIVFCYGSPEYVKKFVRKKDVKIYHERTESPEVLPLSSLKQQKKYLSACLKLDGLFVISTALKGYFVRLGVDEVKIRIINMTVDFQRFISLHENPDKEIYIAYCGTASNNKDGVDELIKAFYLVSKKHDEVKLYIIGPYPSEADEAGNMRLIESLGIEKKVVFTGTVRAEQIPQLLKNATVLALDRPDSIQAQNGFPTKLGEYLMTGNPVVVTNVGDIPLFLKDGESALIAEQRNPEEFAAKICWALEHTKEAYEIGRKGKEVALCDFNYLSESRKIIDFIYG